MTTVLLLGGTSETAPLASALLAQGFALWVSTATDEPLRLPENPRLHHRWGPMDACELSAFMRRESIDALVDGTHPYALEVTAMARKVAAEQGTPYLRYRRESAALMEDDRVYREPEHDSAARRAFTFGEAVLLTTGSRNLSAYVMEARRTNLPICVRVLPREESLVACRDAGLAESEIVAAKGPFSEAENLALIRERRIGVLVSKESGAAGGLPQKLAAAKATGCRVVLVARPEEAGWSDPEDLTLALQEVLRG